MALLCAHERRFCKLKYVFDHAAQNWITNMFTPTPAVNFKNS